MLETCVLLRTESFLIIMSSGFIHKLPPIFSPYSLHSKIKISISIRTLLLFWLFHFSFQPPPDFFLGAYGMGVSKREWGGAVKKKKKIWLVVLIHRQSIVTLSVTMTNSVTITMATDNSSAHSFYSIFSLSFSSNCQIGSFSSDTTSAHL